MRRMKNIASKRSLTAAIALSLLGATSLQSANAADVLDNDSVSAVGSGFYFSGFVGAGFTDDADFSGIVTPPGGQQNVDTDFDTDVNFGASVGYNLGSFGSENISTRVELEVSYLQSDVDELDFSGNGPGIENNTSGDISRLLVMANALVDINTDTAFTPYIGGGLGIAFTDIDIVYGGAAGAPPPVAFDDTDTNFALQGIVGASYAFSENISLFADARYTQVFDVNGDRFLNGGFTGNIDDDLSNASVNVGLRFSF